MSKVVLFGEGKYAEEVYVYLTEDSPHEVAAFTADGAHISRSELLGLPVVPFEEVANRYPPGDFRMFVALGYQDLNRLRAGKRREAREKGYALISYISSRAANLGNVPIGENCLVLENTTLQPWVCIGDNVTLWCNNLIGHHAVVEDHCYVAGHVVVSGCSRIEPYCFLGVNATVGHQVTVGRESLIGAGALITKDVAPRSVHIVEATPRFRLDSRAFMKLTRL